MIGEAAGLAMGLVMLGTNSPMALEDMINVCTVPRGMCGMFGMSLWYLILVFLECLVCSRHST